MKPSEKRALLEKKCQEREAEALRRESECLQVQEDDLVPSVDAQTEKDVVFEKEVKPKKTRRHLEGFFSRHVMIITAVIASLVLFGGVVFGIDALVKFVDENKTVVVDDRIDIDIESVYILHDNFYSAQWRHLEEFNYEDFSYTKKDGKYIIREYPVDGSTLVLKVGGPEKSATPDFMYLIDYDNKLRIDISIDDPRYFVEQYGYFTEEE